MRSSELTCRQLVELVTDYLEGALGEPATGLVDEHLKLCEGCATYVDQMILVVAALGRLPRERPPAKLERAISAALSA
jgi:predicted anti-sigma-YlaC factor YlaD